MNIEEAKKLKDLRETVLTILGYKEDETHWFKYPNGYTRKEEPPELNQILALIKPVKPNPCPLCNGVGEIVERKARQMGYTFAPDEPTNSLEEKIIPCPLCKPQPVKLRRLTDEEIPYKDDVHLDAGVYDGLKRKAFLEGTEAQLDQIKSDNKGITFEEE